MLHKVSQESNPLGILALYCSEDKSYLISLQSNRVTYWQLSNLSIIFQLDTGQPALSFSISEKEKQ
jgi:hypothetical protein